MTNKNDGFPVTLSNCNDLIIEHLTVLQRSMARLAKISNYLKLYCVALTITLMVVRPCVYIIPAVMPALLFMVLDAYYFGIEQVLIGINETFLKKFHNDKLKLTDFFAATLEERKSVFGLIWSTIFSFSVWGFYFFIEVIVLTSFYCL